MMTDWEVRLKKADSIEIVCIGIFILIMSIFLTGCLSYFDTQTGNQSGNELLHYAEQYRHLSSVMIDKYGEQDYDSISRLLVEAVEIAQNVEELQVSNEYENAKTYAENWMYSDAYWFHLVISDGSKDQLSKVFDESTDYLTLFLFEMESLGHSFD